MLPTDHPDQVLDQLSRVAGLEEVHVREDCLEFLTAPIYFHYWRSELLPPEGRIFRIGPVRAKLLYSVYRERWMQEDHPYTYMEARCLDIRAEQQARQGAYGGVPHIAHPTSHCMADYSYQMGRVVKQEDWTQFGELLIMYLTTPYMAYWGYLINDDVYSSFTKERMEQYQYPSVTLEELPDHALYQRLNPPDRTYQPGRRFIPRTLLEKGHP